MTGVAFGINLLFQRAGFQFVPQAENRSAIGPGNINDLMVNFEVTNQAQAIVLASLLRIEITQVKT